MLVQSLEMQKNQLLDSIDKDKYKRVMISRTFLAKGLSIEHIVGYFKMSKIIIAKYSREDSTVLSTKNKYIAG